MKRIAIATAVLTALTLTASLTTSYAADREIGDWMVTTKQSTFKAGAATVLAMTISEGYVLGLRCLGGDLSIALGAANGAIRGGNYTVGERATVRFKAGAGDIIERSVTAISDSMFQVDDVADIMIQIGHASEFAFQLEQGNTQSEISFETKGNGKVSQLVMQSCK
jgi:hypothetical protein